MSTEAVRGGTRVGYVLPAEPAVGGLRKRRPAAGSGAHDLGDRSAGDARRIAGREWAEYASSHALTMLPVSHDQVVTGSSVAAVYSSRVLTAHACACGRSAPGPISGLSR